MIVNQWVPAAHRGDAIGDSARRVRDLLRQSGHQSDLFALTIDDDLREDVRPFADREARAGDITIFHFALGIHFGNFLMHANGIAGAHLGSLDNLTFDAGKRICFAWLCDCLLFDFLFVGHSLLGDAVPTCPVYGVTVLNMALL